MSFKGGLGEGAGGRTFYCDNTHQDVLSKQKSWRQFKEYITENIVKGVVALSFLDIYIYQIKYEKSYKIFEF